MKVLVKLPMEGSYHVDVGFTMVGDNEIADRKFIKISVDSEGIYEVDLKSGNVTKVV